MIHLIGDSHVNSFRGLRLKRHYLGAVTLKRVGVDKELFNFIKKYWECWFCFGEIDVRCHVKNWLHGKLINEVLHDWVSKYARAIGSLDLKKIGIVSIAPPTPKEFADTKEYPVSGTDSERSFYTMRMNHYLREKCFENRWKFIDTYTKNEINGMLPREFSDGTVHLKKRWLWNC